MYIYLCSVRQILIGLCNNGTGKFRKGTIEGWKVDVFFFKHVTG